MRLKPKLCTIMSSKLEMKWISLVFCTLASPDTFPKNPKTSRAVEKV